MNLSEMIAKFRRLRDVKKEIEDRHKEELAPINEMIERVKTMFLKHLQEQNVESIKTEQGTVFRSVQTNATVGDWDATLEFIREREAWELLNRSVNKTAVASLLEEGVHVPGVNFTEFETVNIRKPTAKDK